MKKMMMVALYILLFGSGQVFAACVGTITPSTPTVDFVDHGNSTVTHTKTGLMWKQCSEGLSGVGCATGTPSVHTWLAALQLAETLNAAGGFASFTDWRIPNRNELHSIVERQCIIPAINATIFPAVVSGGFWSSSPVAGGASIAWYVDFNYGYHVNALGKSSNLYVRLVRGGQ